MSRGADGTMSRSRTIEKERAKTRCVADRNAATSHDALLNLVRLLARQAATELVAKREEDRNQ